MLVPLTILCFFLMIRRPPGYTRTDTPFPDPTLFRAPAAAARHRPVRRTAASPLHRARHRRQPRADPDGRALLGARPDRDGAGRGADGRAAREQIGRAHV